MITCLFSFDLISHTLDERILKELENIHGPKLDQLTQSDYSKEGLSEILWNYIDHQFPQATTEKIMQDPFFAKKLSNAILIWGDIVTVDTNNRLLEQDKEYYHTLLTYFQSTPKILFSIYESLQRTASIDSFDLLYQELTKEQDWSIRFKLIDSLTALLIGTHIPVMGDLIYTGLNQSRNQIPFWNRAAKRGWNKRALKAKNAFFTIKQELPPEMRHPSVDKLLSKLQRAMSRTSRIKTINKVPGLEITKSKGLNRKVEGLSIQAKGKNKKLSKSATESRSLIIKVLMICSILVVALTFWYRRQSIDSNW
jgi:hypothetical protein